MTDLYHTIIAAAVKARAMSSPALSIRIVLSAQEITVEGVAKVRHGPGPDPIVAERKYAMRHMDFINRPKLIDEAIDYVHGSLSSVFRQTPKAVR